MENKIWISLKLNCVVIRHQKSRTYINSKWPCFITASLSSSCCSFLTSTLLPRPQGRLGCLKYSIRFYSGTCRIVTSVWCAVFWVRKCYPRRLGIYYLRVWVRIFSVIALYKQNCAIHCGMRNPRGLKVRRYADNLVYLNEYLSVLPGTKINETIFLTELNEMLLNIMHKISSKQACVQGFEC